MSNNFRQELKYVLTNNDFFLINHNLKFLLKIDPYCKGDMYTISSVYFDNYNHTSYTQVKNGLSERWKWRIRFYNHDDSFINLEKKYKINGLTNKKSVRINKEMFDNILNNKVHISNNNHPLLNEFIIKMKTELLKPIICIEYDRIPYTYKIGNVRITLDYNIRYTKKINDLFNSDKRKYYLKEKILEIKYNETIPDFVRIRLGINHLERTSFSKFNHCLEDSLLRR